MRFFKCYLGVISIERRKASHPFPTNSGNNKISLPRKHFCHMSDVLLAAAALAATSNAVWALLSRVKKVSYIAIIVWYKMIVWS